jgi:hypothetical protein
MLPTAFSRISFTCADDTLFNGPRIFVKFVKCVVVVVAVVDVVFVEVADVEVVVVEVVVVDVVVGSFKLIILF